MLAYNEYLSFIYNKDNNAYIKEEQGCLMHSSVILAGIDFRDPVWQFWVGVGSLALSALAIAVTIIMALRGRQRKLLTYEVVSNTSVINVENDVGEDLKLLLEGHLVTKVRLHVIKLMNAGNTAIASEDYPNKLSFQFDSPPYPHPLIRGGIHRTEPKNILPEHQLKNLVSIDAPEQTIMTLNPPLLNPREAIFLKVLLMANHRDTTTMNVIGQIKDGTIKSYTSSQPRVARRVVIAGVLVAFVLGLLISNSIGLLSAFTQGSCALGSIQVGGSTAFYNTALKEAQNYHSLCPISSISVSESSSASGLSDLESGHLQIANSELPSTDANLKDNPVAVIVFALIVNKSVTNISSLTTAQIQQIYSGSAQAWDRVDASAPALPIKVIGRPTTSGTHASFVQYVLGGSEPPLPAGANIVDRTGEVVSMVESTPGAIGYVDLGSAEAASANGSVSILEINQHAPAAGLVENGVYQFWAIEHMYTSKNNSNALVNSFITYVKQDLQTSDTFIRLNAIDSGVLASHP